MHSGFNNKGEFFASEEWLTRWKNITAFTTNVFAEISYLPTKTGTDDWKKSLTEVINKEVLHPVQLYNMDKTRLY